jgi:hypothetical protein
MVERPARPDDVGMTNESTPGWPAAGLPSPKDRETGPSLATWVIGGALVAVGALVLFGFIVPALFSLLWMVLPILLLVVGVRTVSKGAAASPLARIAGWVAIGVGAIWLWNALSLGRILLLGVLVAAGFYAGRRLARR